MTTSASPEAERVSRRDSNAERLARSDGSAAGRRRFSVASRLTRCANSRVCQVKLANPSSATTGKLAVHESTRSG